jgi:hypothetical protein
MTLPEALKAAHELVKTTGKTAAVYVHNDRKPATAVYHIGSAYSEAPKGTRLHTVVSVTGLERRVG